MRAAKVAVSRQGHPGISWLTILPFYGQLWSALIRWLAPAHMVSVRECGDRNTVAMALSLRVSRRVLDGVRVAS